MIPVVALALAFALGVDPRRLALLAGAIYLPLIFAALIALHWYRSRPDEDGSAPIFCEGVAAELRAGANLRDALATAATSVGSSSISADLMLASPMTEVAAHVASGFPAIGDELRLTILAASRSGSDSAALFDEIGSVAIAQLEVRREVRIATAPGRATALVLLGAPIVYLIAQMGSGGLSDLLASSEQRVVVTIGLGLFLTGLATACLVLWRATR